MPPVAFSNVKSQVLPPTSQTARGSYVPILDNILQPPPPGVGPSGHVGFGPIGPAS